MRGWTLGQYRPFLVDLNRNHFVFDHFALLPHVYTMSDEKRMQPPSEAPPPVYLMPVPAYPQKDEAPRTTAPPPPMPTYPLKDETPRTTAPPPPVPVLVPVSPASGRQYQEQCTDLLTHNSSYKVIYF